MRSKIAAAATVAAVYAAVIPPLVLGTALALAVRAGWLVIEESRVPQCLRDDEPLEVH
ncbi:hypothetical protein [Actinomyces howellii]|uniref:Uncharacterized protein n=1 Tax=Actinomyces howellii TaxID=52771 RepID=A0A448HGN3_9ACTO|nr:hypothetical protein [Actinomyces howellii]VEG28024.1 Uncharacterised protein [Actinomyces howellii]